MQLGKVAGVEHGEPVPAAPHVRRLARELGIDIHDVKGSGPGGRISKDDVKAHAKSTDSACRGSRCQLPDWRTLCCLPNFPISAKWGKIERVSMRGVRRKTAEHLWEAWTTIPHVTQHDQADITELEQLRARFAPKAEEAGGKMTVTAIALKVCASALKIFPQFNASIDMAKEEIVYKQYINIGVAVDTDRGLLVPVIRDVDKKNIVELAAELTQLLAESPRQKTDAARYARRDVHHYQPGRHRWHRIFTDRQLSRSRHSRAVALQHGAGMDGRKIRAAAGVAAVSVLRSSPDRRRRRRPLPALDRGSIRTAVLVICTGIGKI